MSCISRHTTARATSFVLAIVLLTCISCSPPNTIEDVRALHDEGRYGESLEPLRVLLDTNSENPEVHYLYGVTLLRTGKPGLAIWSLQKASQAPEWELAASLELAGAALANRSFPTAIKTTTRILELEPDNVPALSMRGAAYLGDRTQPEAALADFERLLELDPEDFTARVQHASALLLLERVEEAQEAITELQAAGEETSLPPNVTAHVCVARATFALERGDLDEAETEFELCLDRFPTDWTVVSEAIPFFDGRGKPDRSDAFLRIALDKEPTASVYRATLADRLQARDRSEEAETLLRAGTELDNASAANQAWTGLASLYLAREDYRAAADAYERAIELGPEPSQQVLLDFADLLSLAGQHDRALEIADSFDQSLFRDLIHARVLLEQNKPSEALDRLDSALRLWPNNAAARYYAARASEQVGDFDRAIENYRQAIRAGAEHTDAPMRLARLHAAEGAPRAALVAIGHRLRDRPNDPDAILFGLKLAEGLTDRSQADGYLARTQRTRSLWSRAVAIRSETLASSQGADAAVKALLADPRLDFADPHSAAALRALVAQMDAAGRLEEAAPIVASAIEAHPDAAEFRTVQGLLLERQGAPATQSRAAYSRALEIDANDAIALTALATFESQAKNVDAAVSYLDRAAAADPSDPTPARMAAELVARSGHSPEAERRYEELLREHPYDAAAALALARIRIARGADAVRTLELARRAMRFGAQDEAAKLMATLEPTPGETAQPSAEP